MQPISNEIREIVVRAKERGEKIATIALWLGISKSSVCNIQKKHKETGSVEPKPFPGRQTQLTTMQLEQIRNTVHTQNDITLEELIVALDLPIKKSRLSEVLISMGFSFKKRHYTPKRNCVKMFK